MVTEAVVVQLKEPHMELTKTDFFITSVKIKVRNAAVNEWWLAHSLKPNLFELHAPGPA